MCDCVERIEEKLTEKFRGQEFRKPFKGVEIERAMLLLDNCLILRTYSKAIIELEGQKKKIEQNIMHSYCPFCGEKLESAKSN